jgi:tRNA 5-methylaminomethyl-2-thiouridine biosynthesis bifunctional protein
MPSSIRPATLAFNAAGVPFSTEFGDIYHSEGSGPGQAEHVFLHGNDLPGRWRSARVFTIVEAGFGIGLNFLVTWQAWEADASRCERLHFVSIERHPFSCADLEVLHARYPLLVTQAAALRAAWPPATPGLHRLRFANGGITLTLAFGDIDVVARDLRLRADAFYLDGFAPDRNTEMWSGSNMKALARLATTGATLSTYTTARTVRDALTAAGFVCTKRTGFAPKRDMLAAHYAPSWPVRRPLGASRAETERHALVIGAGVAGTAIARCMAVRGWRVDIVERGDAPASGASGLYAGVFQPHISSDDGVFSRLSRAAFLYAVDLWRARELRGATLPWKQCGVLTLADSADDEARMTQALSTLRFPAQFAQAVNRGDARTLAGADVAAGGWWCPTAGWMRGSALVRDDLHGDLGAVPSAVLRGVDAVRVHLHSDVATLDRHNNQWQARDTAGAVIAQAPVAILANSHDATRFANFGTNAISAVRGQLSYLRAPPFRAPRSVVCGNGYILPAIDGIAVAGATFDRESSDTQIDTASHDANLARVRRLLPASTIDTAMLQGAVGFRCAARDRLPIIGAVVDVARVAGSARNLAGVHLSDLPRVPGLYSAFAYGSRGLTWASIGAELLASQLDGEPLPVEGALVDAVDPGRFILKRVRRGQA